MNHRILIVTAAALLTTATAAEPAHAQASTKQDAGAHFERGVSLYGEGDYAGALVEFKRAYEIAPNPLVLYNIGQASFQLRDYASALKHLERYLAEAGANPPHAAEVEQSLATLRTRVGRLTVKSNTTAEISVDGEPRGKAPVAGLLLSVGRHKVTARHGDAPPQERTIEIAAGDNAEQTFEFTASAPKSEPPASAPPPPTAPPKPQSSVAATVAWVGAGLFAAGAITTGIIAVNAGKDLDSERGHASASRDRLDSFHSRMRTFAIATDVLSVASLLSGGAALYFTLSPSPSTTVGLSPRSFQLRFTY